MAWTAKAVTSIKLVTVIEDASMEKKFYIE
jgi:hypothetical protein